MSEGDDHLQASLATAARARAARVEREAEAAGEELRRLEDVPPRTEAANAAIAARLADRLDARARRGAAGAKVVQLRPATMTGVVALVAMVAATLLWFRGVGGPGDPGALPAYRLVTQAGLSDMRGAAAGDTPASAMTLTRSQELVLVARPAGEVRGPVEARAFVRSAGHDAPWTGTVLVAPSGAVQLVGAVRDLVAPGAEAFDAEVVVGRPGTLPTSFDATRATGQAMHVHVDVKDGPGEPGH